MKENISEGMKVVCYEPYGRDITGTAKEEVVTKVGRQYIHVGKLKMKFDKDTLSCDSLNYRLYLGTLDEFREAVGLQKTLLGALDALRRGVDINRPLQSLRDLNSSLSNLLKRSENG